jgi:hypothetical protein
MSMATHYDEYEKHARNLEHISEGIDRGSPEYAALERAGWALAFVTMHHHKEFEQFLAEKDTGELSSEQLAFLRKLGLE